MRSIISTWSNDIANTLQHIVAPAAGLFGAPVVLAGYFSTLAVDFDENGNPIVPSLTLYIPLGISTVLVTHALQWLLRGWQSSGSAVHSAWNTWYCTMLVVINLCTFLIFNKPLSLNRNSPMHIPLEFCYLPPCVTLFSVTVAYIVRCKAKYRTSKISGSSRSSMLPTIVYGTLISVSTASFVTICASSVHAPRSFTFPAKGYESVLIFFLLVLVYSVTPPGNQHATRVTFLLSVIMATLKCITLTVSVLCLTARANASSTVRVGGSTATMMIDRVTNSTITASTMVAEVGRHDFYALRVITQVAYYNTGVGNTTEWESPLKDFAWVISSTAFLLLSFQAFVILLQTWEESIVPLLQESRRRIDFYELFLGYILLACMLAVLSAVNNHSFDLFAEDSKVSYTIGHNPSLSIAPPDLQVWHSSGLLWTAVSLALTSGGAVLLYLVVVTN